MKQKLIRFLQSNFIIWAFWAVAVVIELTGVCVTSGRFLIRRPFMWLSLMSVFTAILFAVKRPKGRYWCAFSFMLVFFVIDLVFIVVYDMTGSTFDFAMLKLRGDAMAIIESIPINFVYVSVSGICISLYLLLARYFLKKVPAPQRILPRGIIAGVLAAILFLHGGVAYMENRNVNPADLSYKLYSGSDGTYYDRGILGNFIDELYKGAFFSKVPLGDETELENYIYASRSDVTGSGYSDYHGIAKGHNVITILGESFEWFSFMADLADAGLDDAYPGGFQTDESTLRALYPNLYKLYDTSTVCLNHHAREKTDISENQSILGNYPTDCYINYDYPENTIPYSLPNILKALYDVDSYSFHNGEYTFYNRNVHHESALGFAKYTASEQMVASEQFKNYFAENAERNLDSEMMEACKEQMFPADRRFNTYITTITMHGQYEQRKNLDEHYAKLFAYGIAQKYADKSGSLENAVPFIHYAAAALELDKAIGVMMQYLENTRNAQGERLADKTIIVLFGDHNAYYQSLTNDVKNIFLEDGTRNYTDLFRVPLMVHVGGTDLRDRITKFTTTTDIIPTILDLLGIRYFDNLTYGRSIFIDEESILYSRAYDVFVTDKMFFTSLKNVRYRSADADDAYIAKITQSALTLLDKTSHVNRIFYYDFLSGQRAETYYAKLREIN